MRTKLHLSHLLPSLAGLLLVAFGSTILVWVGWLTWYDMTSWGKDIAVIFFGSRAGEAISLGIGMKVIHYFLISLALLLLGLLTFLRRRIKAIRLHFSRRVRVQPEKEEEKSSDCLYYFGYLASRPKKSPIPEECLLCPRMADCIVMTVFIDKGEKGEIKLRP